MPEVGVRVEGLRELDRAFKLYSGGMEKGLREAMTAAAEVVRPDAEGLATSALKPVRSVDWTRMRVGVARRSAYVAPVERGRFVKSGRLGRERYSRPKTKSRLLVFALEPALERNRARVAREFQDALVDLARIWGRV